MTGVNPRFKHGPITYEVNAPVKGGQVVEPDGTTGKIKPATAGSAKVLGVALTDAKPDGPTTSTDADGFPVTVVPTLTKETVVEDNAWIPGVTYAAAATFGAALKAAANGQVTPWVSGTDAADLIIGYCAAPAGVATGAKGLTRISR